MPIVAGYGAPKVDLAALPGVRRTAAETPLSEGAGVADAHGRAAGQLAGVGQEFAQFGEQKYAEIADNARTAADQTAMLDANNQLASWENSRLYDPQNGALNLKGKASFDLPEQIDREFNDTADKIAAGLGTDKQRQMFAALRAQRQQDVALTVRRHVAGELQTYEGQELQGLVENSVSAAVANAQDPRRVGEEIARAQSAIRQSADRLGLGPEEVVHQLEAVASTIHVGVIENLLAAEKTSAAQVYFDETKDQISGQSLTRVEAALKTSTDRAEAQQQTDAILALTHDDGSPLTLAEQRDHAKALTDPKLRDAVNERLEHEAAIASVEANRQERARVQSVYDVIDRTSGDITKVPAATWAQLDGGARSAAREYALRVAKGDPIVTDPTTYYAFMKWAADDPETFRSVNLLTARTKLDTADFKQLADLQLAIAKGDREKANQTLTPFLTREQLLNTTLTQYGLDPGAKPGTDTGKAIANLKRLVDAQVNALEAPYVDRGGQPHAGKKATNADVQDIIDGILKTNVGTPGSWWGTLNLFDVPNLAIGAADYFGAGVPKIPSFFGSNKAIINTTISDVPATDRALIEQALRRRGVPVTDQTILSTFQQTKARLANTGGGR